MDNGIEQEKENSKKFDEEGSAWLAERDIKTAARFHAAVWAVLPRFPENDKEFRAQVNSISSRTVEPREFEGYDSWFYRLLQS